MKAIAVIALIVALVIVGPLALILSLNTLFPALAIPYTVQTWLAAAVLSAPFVNRGS